MRAAIIIGVAVLVGFAIGMLLWFTVTSATAGIGPRGFAFYARQGINHGITLTYGSGNSPYTVHCQDHPNYQTLGDNVTCQIRLKP